MHKSLVQPYQITWFDRFCLWYPPGWLILFNRHWQHYYDDPDGWNWLEYGLFLIPGGFYLALLIRWLRLGCRFPRTNSSAIFDPNYQQSFRKEVLDFIVKNHFKGELKQLENLPQTDSLIIAMNHAGMCFPWDFLTLACLLSQSRAWIVQPLAGVSLFEHPWVTWWLPPGWSQVLGGVRAEYDEFEAALAHQIILLYAPEGLSGPGKGWGKRYQLQTFHPSFVRLSDRYQIPILPVICMGNEFLHPWAFNLQKLAKKLSLPFLPLSPLIIVFLLFPSMGVWANKTRLTYWIQALTKPGLEEISPKENRSKAYQKAQELKKQFQTTLDKHLMQ